MSYACPHLPPCPFVRGHRACSHTDNALKEAHTMNDIYDFNAPNDPDGAKMMPNPEHEVTGPNPYKFIPRSLISCPNNAGRQFKEQYSVKFCFNPDNHHPHPADRFDTYSEALDFALRFAGEQQDRTVHHFQIEKFYVRVFPE